MCGKYLLLSSRHGEFAENSPTNIDFLHNKYWVGCVWKWFIICSRNGKFTENSRNKKSSFIVNIKLDVCVEKIHWYPVEMVNLLKIDQIKKSFSTVIIKLHVCVEKIDWPPVEMVNSLKTPQLKTSFSAVNINLDVCGKDSLISCRNVEFVKNIPTKMYFSTVNIKLNVCVERFIDFQLKRWIPGKQPSKKCLSLQ